MIRYRTLRGGVGEETRDVRRVLPDQMALGNRPSFRKKKVNRKEKRVILADAGGQCHRLAMSLLPRRVSDERCE